MAGLSERASLVLVALEAVEGVPEVLDPATHAVLANEVSPVPQPDIITSAEFTGSLDAGEPEVGGIPMQISIQTYVKGSGALGVEPEVDPLLKACGWDATVAAGVSVTYAPVSVAIPSVTIGIFRAAQYLWTFSGCRGNLQITKTTRQLAVYDFTMTGRFVSHADAVPAAATFDATRPPPWRNGVFSIDGAPAAVQQVSFNANNTIALPDDPNEVEGFQAPCVTARDIQGTMNPLKELPSTRDLFDAFRTGTPSALIAGIGTVPANIVTITIPRAKYTGNTEGNRDSLIIEDVPFSAVGTDDGLTIVYT